MLKIAQTQSLDSKEIVRENLGQKFLLEKKLELLTFSPFFRAHVFYQFFSEKNVFFGIDQNQGVWCQKMKFSKKIFFRQKH